MPQYFMNIRCRNRFIPDDEGCNISGPDSAVAQATAAARELLVVAIQGNADLSIDEGRIEIVDENGQCVGTVTLREVLDRAERHKDGAGSDDKAVLKLESG